MKLQDWIQELPEINEIFDIKKWFVEVSSSLYKVWEDLLFGYCYGLFQIKIV